MKGVDGTPPDPQKKHQAGNNLIKKFERTRPEKRGDSRMGGEKTNTDKVMRG